MVFKSPNVSKWFRIRQEKTFNSVNVIPYMAIGCIPKYVSDIIDLKKLHMSPMRSLEGLMNVYCYHQMGQKRKHRVRASEEPWV